MVTGASDPLIRKLEEAAQSARRFSQSELANLIGFKAAINLAIWKSRGLLVADEAAVLLEHFDQPAHVDVGEVSRDT